MFQRDRSRLILARKFMPLRDPIINLGYLALKLFRPLR
jgi:hypothetical protein